MDSEVDDGQSHLNYYLDIGIYRCKSCQDQSISEHTPIRILLDYSCQQVCISQRVFMQNNLICKVTNPGDGGPAARRPRGAFKYEFRDLAPYQLLVEKYFHIHTMIWF